MKKSQHTTPIALLSIAVLVMAVVLLNFLGHKADRVRRENATIWTDSSQGTIQKATRFILQEGRG